MNWQRFFRRKWWDKERASEIDAYLETETVENIARGMPPAEAAAAARRKFGNPVQIQEEIYRMNSIGWLESIWQDLRYAARQLRLSPGFAAVAIASLALGIGANTAIFQLLDAVRLRSLPVHNPQELAEVRIVGGNQGMGINPGLYAQLTRPIWEQLRKQPVFSGALAWSPNELRVGQGSELRRANGIRVSGDFFRVLGVNPWRGRLILPADEAAACPAFLAVVSYSYWQSNMGGRELDGNSRLMVNGKPQQVIGVTPPEFFGLAVGESFDIAEPFCQPKEMRRDVFDLTVMGRIPPRSTLDRASSQLTALSPGIFQETALTGYGSRTIERYKNFKLAAYPASGGVSNLRSVYNSSLWILLGITGMVLLIASTNLANLMLARASVREREVAVRLALGASRGRLIRQLLAESGLLAIIGGTIGIGIAQFLTRVLIWSLSTGNSSVNLPIETDWRVFVFAAAVAGFTCIIFGLVPALRATKAEPVSAMKSGGRGTTESRERFSVQKLMIVSQIAVSLVLLVGALLFVRSFRNLMTLDPGMRRGGITIAFMGFQQSQVPRERYLEFQRELLEEVRSTPGILNAASTSNVPLLGSSWTHGIRIGSAEGSSRFTWVSPRYFQTMGIPIIAGRDLNQNDTTASTRVAVVNQAFVRQFLGESNPIGLTLRTGAEPNYPATTYEIVGVIADTKYSGLREATQAMTFAPAPQHPAPGPWMAAMIHSNGTPAMTVAAVKNRIAAKHPEIVMEFSDFQTRIQDGLVRERLMAMLTGFFGLLAALLAMIGLYGVVSYVVTRRRNEIGIRMALGARGGQVAGMIVREAARLLAIGVVIGTALALIAGRSASSLLFGLKPYDPLTLAGASVLLTVIALGASFLPARRASRMDPMAALRHE
jgi:predicted permease